MCELRKVHSSSLDRCTLKRGHHDLTYHHHLGCDRSSVLRDILSDRSPFRQARGCQKYAPRCAGSDFRPGAACHPMNELKAQPKQFGGPANSCIFTRSYLELFEMLPYSPAFEAPTEFTPLLSEFQLTQWTVNRFKSAWKLRVWRVNAQQVHVDKRRYNRERWCLQTRANWRGLMRVRWDFLFGIISDSLML